MGAFDGKVVLVTGGGTGIGKGIAKLFVAEGATVVIAGRRLAPLQAVAAALGPQVSVQQLDLAKPAGFDPVLDAIVARHGTLDVLVNNAAYQMWKTFDETTDEEIADLFYTNTTGITLLIKRVLPHLRASKGNIVNISSTASRYTVTPSQKLAVYGASKAALNQLTRTLAPEFGPQGVRINAVCPGLTRAEYSEESLGDDPATQEWIRTSAALGRMGEPEDIAKVVAFLASDQAAWVTGQVIDAAGGWQISAG